MKIAIYPGSFDLMHEGHLNIINKASLLFDKVYVVVTNNPEKKCQENIDTRFEYALKLVSLDNVEIIKNESKLTVDVAKELNAKWIIRSGRNDIDFQYELELAAANKHLDNEVETVLIMPDLKDVKFQSRLIKQGAK